MRERERERENERQRGMENEKEGEIGQDQAVALSARRAWLGRRAHRSAHIMCSRALSLCAVLQPLRRSASQVECVRASKSAHARGAGGGGKKRKKHETGNRDGTRNACRTLLLHSSTCINGFYRCCGLAKTERRRGLIYERVKLV